jgi:hypothetical protein
MAVAMSKSTGLTSPFRLGPTNKVGPASSLLIGVKDALAAGRMRTACCNLPPIFRNRLSGALCFLRMLLVSCRSGRHDLGVTGVSMLLHPACRRENLRVLVNSTKKGVSQLHKGHAESTSKQEYTEMSIETT